MERVNSECRRQNRQGFTMLGNVAVMMFLSIVAAVKVPPAVSAIQEMQLERAEKDLQMLSSAMLRLARDTDTTATEKRGLPHYREIWDLGSAKAGIVRANPDRFPRWKGPYLQEVPRDPWGSKYFFDPDYSIGKRHYSVIGSFGPNRQGRNIYDSDNIYVIVK
ncbi:MAG: type II secretion system protein GspG [Lentisphaerae bacterium]|nr:type II secretion system protein GspG [Lentisphaerota bacterium]